MFDVRGYPDSNQDLLGYLLRERDESKWMQVPELSYPDQQGYIGGKYSGWSLQPAQPHIGVAVAFITDARAISFAESFMGIVEGHSLGAIIGAPTAGANGNVNGIATPGGFEILFTGMKVTRIDGRQHHLIGVEPAEPTIEGIAAGRDELYERALAYLREPRN